MFQLHLIVALFATTFRFEVNRAHFIISMTDDCDESMKVYRDDDGRDEEQKNEKFF